MVAVILANAAVAVVVNPCPIELEEARKFPAMRVVVSWDAKDVEVVAPGCPTLVVD